MTAFRGMKLLPPAPLLNFIVRRRKRSILLLAVSEIEGGRRAADKLPRVWPPGLARGRGVSPMRPRDAVRGAGAGGPTVLLVLGGGDHTLPELRGAQLRSAPPEHLRLARPGGGLRVAVRE